MWEIWEDICTSAWLYENHAVYTHMHATWHKFMKNTHQSKYPDQENACSQITAATTSPYNNRHGLCVEVTVWARHRQQETSTFTLGVSMTSASSRKSRNLQSYHLDQSDRALDCACWKSWGAFYSTKIFHQKCQISAKICLKNIFYAFSFVLSWRFGDLYRRLGDSKLMRES